MNSRSGSPAEVQPGVIVRIRINHNTVYASKRLHRGEARDVAAKVRKTLSGNFNGFVVIDGFPSADLEELSLRVSQVTAVEVRCVNADGSLIPAAEQVPA